MKRIIIASVFILSLFSEAFAVQSWPTTRADIYTHSGGIGWKKKLRDFAPDIEPGSCDLAVSEEVKNGISLVTIRYVSAGSSASCAKSGLIYGIFSQCEEPIVHSEDHVFNHSARCSRYVDLEQTVVESVFVNGLTGRLHLRRIDRTTKTNTYFTFLPTRQYIQL